MRLMNRLNPGPGLADFWTEFKRPNPYRWPILGVSLVLTAGLLVLLSGTQPQIEYVILGIVGVIAAVMFFAFRSERIGFNFPSLALAAGITVTLMYAFTQERVVVPPQPPEVTYITTFAPGRTDEEIMQANIESQRLAEQRAAAEAERRDRAREIYRRLGRMSGMDVERIEREAEAERAREEAAETARREAMLGGTSEDGPD